MYFIGVSGLRVLPLLINGWMDLYSTVEMSNSDRCQSQILVENRYLSARRNIAVWFGMEKLEWSGYLTVKKLRNVRSF